MILPLAALVLALAAPASALTPGGGPIETDCLAEFGGTPPNSPASRPRDLRCTDGDPDCDDDPEAGICRFRVEVCLNVSDPACAPADLDAYLVENEQPDTNPRHDFDFQALEDRLDFLVLPIDASSTDVCSGEVFMNLRLPIRLTNGGARYRRAKKTLRTTLTGPGGTEDVDRLRMTCVAAEDADPCAGVGSTFDQIQRHVFTPTCAVPTCHNAAQDVHLLSLSPGEAYGFLVGVEPANGAAAIAGKLRVDPGNPANSFLLDKVRGVLAPGEGERMPRGLKRLETRKLDLIEEWIAAGAPETGFVAPIGCH
ncbi:MAG TPA: hypothetical protein VKA21_02520 [Candidatus Binatia bacterium]|nr:hypothetical protein [Candidatus Binatia bacterium]